jgi:hypothetical protein
MKELLNVERVFIADNYIVITGTPDSDDELHNCDQMGCNTCEHVLLRASINDVLKGYNPDGQEV